MPDRPTMLFLTYFFPPLQAVGAIRAASIAKHLSRVGWEVSVVTPAPDLWQACDDPERTAAEIRDWGVRMIHTGHRWRCLSSGSLKRSNRRDGARWLMEAVPRFLARRMRIDEMIGWYPEAERACAQLRPGEVDVVMATGSPFGAFGIAERLARRLECPYVLDYRDLWSGNPHNRRGRGARRERTEQRLLTGCAALSVVSSSMARYLGDRFGVAEKVHVIPNGYDPDDFASIEPTPFDHLAIVYAGQFLPPKRDAGPLMRMLRQVAESQPTRTWRFHYYGPSGDHVCQAAKIHNVEQLVELHGVTPRRQCLAAIRGATAAVVVVSVDDNATLADRGIVTGKIFEPIGLGTPVLVIAPPGSDVNAVVRTVGRGAVFSASDADGMTAFLLDVIRGKGPESRHPDAYAWSNLIRRFDAMFRQLETGGSDGKN